MRTSPPKSPSPLHFVCREGDFTKQKRFMVKQKRVPTSIGVIILATIILLFGNLPVAAQDLVSASVAYDNGDYETAIILYESSLAVGEVSGEIYYNLGNAYYLNGEIGRAIQNYLQAESYLPRHDAIASQIAVVRAERVDGQLDEIDPLVIAHHLTADYLTMSETAILGFVVWLLFFFVLAIGMRRKGWKIVIVVFGIVMLLAIGLLGIRVYVDTQEPVAVVLSDTGEAMSGPGENYLALFSLYEGIELRVQEERDGWLRFVLADGRQGWIDRAVTGEIQ